ncbi:unnamed protein product [Rhizophagus irregularis]|nr:unnamed protein product [Rhizophagus irregularis]
MFIWTPDIDNNKTSPQSIIRIYGISFPNAQELKSWKQERDLAHKLDHRDNRKISKTLFNSSFESRIYLYASTWHSNISKLQNYIRVKYRKFGYEEVMTPMIFKKELWETSGHWQNYQNEMFTVHYHNDNSDVYRLKPMNCPGHCLIFDSAPKSFRDLPLRLADFGSLHRLYDDAVC